MTTTTRLIAILSVALSVAGTLDAQQLFINEFHYDNTGGDVGEFIELAGPTGTDLTGWEVRLYNGSNGETYSPIIDLTGSGFTNQNNGFGTAAFFAAGIQNGSPDGFALVDSSGLVHQFLSYGGSFVAANGPASGMNSVDVGVSESSSTPIGSSLQLSGNGTSYGDFTWNAPAPESPGTVNSGQTFNLSAFTHVLPAAGTTTTLDFNDFDGSGFAPNPLAGQLDSDNFSINGFSDGDLVFGDSANAGDFARGVNDGGTGTGGIYAFDPNNDGNRALGVHPGADDFTPGSITLRLPNETSAIIDELLISADILINNDQERSNSFDVSFSTDGINFTNLAMIDSLEASDLLGFQSTNIGGTLTGLGLNPGDFLFLRVTGDDVSGSGSRDEFAIDNLQISQVAVPEPASFLVWSLLGIATVIGLWRRQRYR